jgi:hypothetical protein
MPAIMLGRARRLAQDRGNQASGAGLGGDHLEAGAFRLVEGFDSLFDQGLIDLHKVELIGWYVCGHGMPG